MERHGQGTEARRRQPRLLFLARHFYGAARAELEAITRDHGLTPADYSVLDMIARRAPCSAAEIARLARITPQAATQQIATLAAKRMIGRRPNLANRRIVLIEPTSAGIAALADIDARADRLEQRMAAGFDQADLAVIRRFLSRDFSAEREDSEEKEA